MKDSFEGGVWPGYEATPVWPGDQAIPRCTARYRVFAETKINITDKHIVLIKAGSYVQAKYSSRGTQRSVLNLHRLVLQGIMITAVCVERTY